MMKKKLISISLVFLGCVFLALPVAAQDNEGWSAFQDLFRAVSEWFEQALPWESPADPPANATPMGMPGGLSVSPNTPPGGLEATPMWMPGGLEAPGGPASVSPDTPPGGHVEDAPEATPMGMPGG